MTNKNIFIITIVNSIILLFLVVFLWFYYNQKENRTEYAYVDNIKLFNGFNMTKDLNQINNGKINAQKKKLDSLYTIYNIFKENNKSDKLEGLENQLRNEDQQLKKMNERFSNDLGEQVWKRLNQYVEEYGVDKGYKIIFGTQGNGNVMYAETGIDITNEIINYANTNYEGNQYVN